MTDEIEEVAEAIYELCFLGIKKGLKKEEMVKKIVLFFTTMNKILTDDSDVDTDEIINQLIDM